MGSHLSIGQRPPASILILAAHADDAITGVGGWLCGRPGAVAVAYLTDSVPRDVRFFTDGTRDPDAYRRRRRREATAAWQRHRPEAHLYFGAIADQELPFEIGRAAAWTENIIRQTRPDLLLTPAFEGGHPDHDAVNCLAARLGRHARVPVVEYALYARYRGQIVRLRFPEAPHLSCRLNPTSLMRKRWALACFRSQRRVLAEFDAVVEWESLRPLAAHNYSQRPGFEATVYEGWKWPYSAADVAAALASWQSREKDEPLMCAF